MEDSEPAVEVKNLVENASDVEENKSDQSEEARENGMEEIFVDGPRDLACWLLPATINNHRFDMLVDSGATRTLIDTTLFRKYFPELIAKPYTAKKENNCCKQNGDAW